MSEERKTPNQFLLNARGGTTQAQSPTTGFQNAFSVLNNVTSNNPNKEDLSGESGEEEEELEGESGSRTRPSKKIRREKNTEKGFSPKTIALMMYGFGDVEDPLQESVALLDKMVLEYIHEMTLKAVKLRQLGGKISHEDLLFLVRKDPKKFQRVRELLKVHKDVTKYRKSVKEDAQ